MNKQYLASLVMTMGLAACGGGGGDSSTGTPPAVPFAVASTLPQAGATGVDRNGTVTINFNAALNATSASSAVQLLGPAGNVIPTTATVAGSTLSITPVATGLPGDTQYTVKLASTLADSTGRQLGSEQSLAFTTVAQAWSPLNNLFLNPRVSGGEQPSVVADVAGNVTLAWARHNYMDEGLTAIRKNAGSSTWQAPVSLVTSIPFVTYIGSITLAPGANGQATLSWGDYSKDTSIGQTLVASYDKTNNTWGAPAEANIAAAPLQVRQLLSSASGKIIAITDDQPRVVANRLASSTFDPATRSWQPTKLIYTFRPGAYVVGAAAKMSPDGNIILAWAEDHIQYAAYYSATKDAWTQPQNLGSTSMLSADSPTQASMAIDGNGIATIAWRSTVTMDAPRIIKLARFDPASNSWNVNAEWDNDSVGTPMLLADAAGNTTVIWQRTAGAYYARLSPKSTTWTAPAQLPGVSSSDAINGTAVIDVAGNITMVYKSNLMTAVRYSATTKQWQTPVVMGRPAVNTVEYFDQPSIAVDGAGTVTAAWFSSNRIGTTWTYEYWLVETGLR